MVMANSGRHLKQVILMLVSTWGLCLASQTSFAQKAKVLSVKGNVTFNGKALASGDRVDGAGVFKTAENGSAKVFFLERRSISILRPNGELKVGKDNSLNLVKGLSRFVVGKIKGKTPKLSVKTKTAVMGIRGTDFIIIANPMFQETEIVNFKGAVEFTNASDNADSKVVQQNQWGGIGGRFGSQVGDLIDLPPHIIRQFKEDTDMGTDVPGAQPANDLHGQAVPIE